MFFLDRVKDFLGEQSRNYRVILVRSIFASFFFRLVSNFSNIYTVALGASPVQLSTVRAVGSGVSAMVAIPAGWLSDMYSLKKILILGMFLQVLSSLFYASAQDWTWIIVAAGLWSIIMTLVWRTQSIFIANSLAERKRGTGYGMRRTLIQAFSIAAPAVGGALIHRFGGLSVEGIRPLYYIQVLGYTLITIYVALRIEDVETSGKEGSFFNIGGLIKDFREMFKAGAGTGLKRFLALQALGSISWGMIMPFIFVYATEVKGADSLLIGYMGTCTTVATMVLALPLGILSDRIGRKPAIFLTRPSFWVSSLLFVFTPENMLYLLLLAGFLRGVMMSGIGAWSSLRMEMVPQEYRGRWTGLINFFQNLVRAPAMLLGGYLYQNVNPALVFIIPVFIDAIIRMPLLYTIPETLEQ